MSLRPIELQTAIPRIHEVGKIQDQQQHHPRQEQVELGLQMQREEERNQARPVSAQSADEGHIKDRNQKKGDTKQQQKKSAQHPAKSKQDQKDSAALHPYMGHTIDITF
ncbi:hypothetical protein [Aneurinibacillus terranovensis]|uniref:hypothetical protein n=1 Tax=Aneurinibacillus terranovensis TaxID=278991 RepID=UPI000408B806|nr:hypothetical protein [Aneurinibacillus terranovensis]